jgi:hypothetical protein
MRYWWVMMKIVTTASVDLQSNGKHNELEYNYLITCRYLDLVKNQKIENVQAATTK